MDPIHLLQAEVCRTLSHPARIAIRHLLADGPLSVSTLALKLDIAQPNASQHLAVMRAAGLVEAKRDGREVIYRLALARSCSTRLTGIRFRAAASDTSPQVARSGEARTALVRASRRVFRLQVAPPSLSNGRA